MSAHADLERLEELSVADALGELTDTERAEYEALRASHPEFDPSITDRAVGAALGALHSSQEPLPEAVQRAIVREGERFVSQREQAAPMGTTAAPPPVMIDRARRRTTRPSPAWWSLAAVVLLSIGIWSVLPKQPASAPAAAEQRQALLESGRNLVRATWTAGGDVAGQQVQGDVVWDPQTQTGYMRFVGLQPNSPTLEQYQLWIFDSTRDERYPVDGGVFDVSATGEVIIPIKATLRVNAATLFAVTVEQPGGVVVSSRARIAALAKTS